MTDKEKLLKLADWFDAHDAKRGIRDTAVQDDLRRIAAALKEKDAEINALKKRIEEIKLSIGGQNNVCKTCSCYRSRVYRSLRCRLHGKPYTRG